MGKHYVVLSFFKDKRIDYFFDAKRMKITFPCLYCLEEAEMNATSSEWHCDCCNQSGNLLTLIQFDEKWFSEYKRSVFNPKKERHSLDKLMDSVLDKVIEDDVKRDLNQIKNQIDKLLTYHEQNVV